MSRPFSLDSRLSLCSEFVREGRVVADIGTDHAYLPVSLVLSGKVPKAIASDINPDPLEKGRLTIKKYGLEDKISTRLSPGLEKISEGEAQDIVIAGMGGETIISILSAAPWVKSPEIQLVLQPMSKPHLLLQYLSEEGFEIIRQETCTAADKLYTVIAATFTGKASKKDVLYPYVGELSPEKNPLDRAFIEAQLHALLKKAPFSKEAKLLSEKLKERLCEL